MDAEDEGRESSQVNAVAENGPNNDTQSSEVDQDPNNDHGNPVQSDEEVVDMRKGSDEERALFQLTVVNSYGSQEVQKLERKKIYKFSSEPVHLC